MTKHEKLEQARKNLRRLDRTRKNARRARRCYYWVNRFNALLR